jgi:hypothetical protein
MRYKPKPSERIAGSKRAGRENNPTKTVENLKTKKLKRISSPHHKKQDYHYQLNLVAMRMFRTQTSFVLRNLNHTHWALKI